MLRQWLILGMIILPMFVSANEADHWGLDELDNLLEEGQCDSVFEKLQLSKARVLQERRRGPGRPGEETVSASLSTFSQAEFRKKTLQDGELFLDTYASGRRSLVFVVTKEQCRLLELPGDEEIRLLLTRLHGLASKVESDQNELAAVASKVFEMLLGDLKDELKSCNKIIFAPDGIFNLVPTSLLLPSEQNTTFSRVPSASILMDLRNSSGSRLPVEEPRTLAVGGVYHSATGDLPPVYRELEKLNDTFTGITLVRPNGGGIAPELNKMKGFDIIHVAAPSFGDDRNPWQSTIALDPENPEMMIRAAELDNIQLDTRLVVLANCSSATGSVLSGEGVQGLTSAFLAAGVPSVVAAQWPVDDDATGFFMSSFYEGLSLGKDVAGALSFARSKCRQDPMFNLPFHWGAFILVGDGQVEIPLEVKSGFSWGHWLGLLAGVGAGLFYVLRIKR